MTADEATDQRQRLLLTSHRLILRTRRLLEKLHQNYSEEAVVRAERQITDYWRRYEAVEKYSTRLRVIVDRGDAVLN